MKSYAYYKEVFAGREMPFAFLDLDLLNQNIQELLPRANGKLIRVASKSVRSRFVLDHIFKSNPQFQGIMAFTAREAVWLSQCGHDDILIGYPTFHEKQVDAICEELKKGKTIVCMVDSERQVHHLDRIASKNKVEMPVCIDLDMSIKLPGLHFGVFRSPVTNEKQAMQVAEKIIQCENIKLDSLMGYEAQIAGLGDNYRGKFLKNKAVSFLKANAIRKIAERRRNVVNAIESKGLTLRVVNGGGTGSMESTCKEDAVTEVTVGSGFYSPALFDNYTKFKHKPAAGYAVEIVRRPRNDIYTCHGGGYVASGGCDPDKIPKPFLPEGAKLTVNEAAGEVQTPVLYTGGQKLALGDPIFFRHSKAGELNERFNSMLVVSGGKVVDEISSYRGEGKCFL